MVKKESRRVLVVGGDGRAHALVKACNRSPIAEVVLCAPGNGGIHASKRRAVAATDFPGLVALCRDEKITVVLVSAEAQLKGDGKIGIVDYFKQHLPEVLLFGPTAAAAMLEWSKIYCYRIAQKNGIRMPQGDIALDMNDAMRHIYVHLHANQGVVIKMDGLAAGKGVLVTSEREAAVAFAREGLRHGSLLIQEKLVGKEASLICFCDGTTVMPLPLARDFKRAHDGDEGPNTGGMGAYAPLPEYPVDGPIYAQMCEMAQKVAHGIAQEGKPFVGFLYLGLMVVGEDVYLLEVNARGGDPETEVLLALFESDFLSFVVACCTGELAKMPRPRFKPGAAVCVIVASEGYPDAPKPQGSIAHEWLIKLGSHMVMAYHAGTRQTDGVFEPTGGRVLALTATAGTHERARDRIYGALRHVGAPFPGARWRTDIAEGV